MNTKLCGGGGGDCGGGGGGDDDDENVYLYLSAGIVMLYLSKSTSNNILNDTFIRSIQHYICTLKSKFIKSIYSNT